MMGTQRPGGVLGFAVPLIAAAGAALRAQYGPGVSVCLVIAIVLAPVWLSATGRYRLARPLLLAGVGAGVWGALISLLDTGRPTTTSLLVGNSLMLLSLLSAIGMLLWARSAVGAGWTVAAFGVGGLVNVVLTGGNPANLWKYSLAIPVALLLLGVAMIRGSRALELVVLVGVAGVSAVSDSRSMTAFLLVAAVVVLWQSASRGERRRPRPWQTILGLGGLGAGAYFLFQALILDGALGQAAAERTQAQIDTAGSLIAGGRPEMGAAAALIAARPGGYGSGAVPSANDVWLAKGGMSTLGYDPDNGYVERYMFGTKFEVHSVLGDLWITFGPLGALFALALGVLAVYATARAVSLRTASAALVFLTLLGVWDVFFSPVLTSYPTLALMVALAAVPRASEALGAAGGPPGVGGAGRRPAHH